MLLTLETLMKCARWSTDDWAAQWHLTFSRSAIGTYWSYHPLSWSICRTHVEDQPKNKLAILTIGFKNEAKTDSLASRHCLKVGFID